MLGLCSLVSFLCDGVGNTDVDREDFSISLNFRAAHACKTSLLMKHKLGVLFGRKPSILSDLRQHLLESKPMSLEERVVTLSTTVSSPCYLTLSDGNTTSVIEKDFNTSFVSSSDTFIIKTNHDTQPNDAVSKTRIEKQIRRADPVIAAYGNLYEDSVVRHGCMQDKWDKHVKGNPRKGISDKVLREWMSDVLTNNEQTHFACVMDPKKGEIAWIERGEAVNNRSNT